MLQRELGWQGGAWAPGRPLARGPELGAGWQSSLTWMEGEFGRMKERFSAGNAAAPHNLKEILKRLEVSGGLLVFAVSSRSCDLSKPQFPDLQNGEEHGMWPQYVEGWLQISIQ